MFLNVLTGVFDVLANQKLETYNFTKVTMFHKRHHFTILSARQDVEKKEK